MQALRPITARIDEISGARSLSGRSALVGSGCTRAKFTPSRRRQHRRGCASAIEPIGLGALELSRSHEVRESHDGVRSDRGGYNPKFHMVKTDSST